MVIRTNSLLNHRPSSLTASASSPSIAISGPLAAKPSIFLPSLSFAEAECGAGKAAGGATLAKIPILYRKSMPRITSSIIFADKNPADKEEEEEGSLFPLTLRRTAAAVELAAIPLPAPTTTEEAEESPAIEFLAPTFPLVCSGGSVSER
ncbi:hypothetical protein KC324_g21607 [Hortaea werneckii]|nr:hypothetical protein KC324_g21607 [Hortaea werneckii]